MRYARFYEAFWFDADNGRQRSFHRKKRDALEAIETAKSDFPTSFQEPSDVNDVSMELSTDGIIAWLNRQEDWQ